MQSHKINYQRASGQRTVTGCCLFVCKQTAHKINLPTKDPFFRGNHSRSIFAFFGFMFWWGVDLRLCVCYYLAQNKEARICHTPNAGCRKLWQIGNQDSERGGRYGRADPMRPAHSGKSSMKFACPVRSCGLVRCCCRCCNFALLKGLTSGEPSRAVLMSTKA